MPETQGAAERVISYAAGFSAGATFHCFACAVELAKEPTCYNVIGCKCGARNDIPQTFRNREYRERLMEGFC